MNLRLKRFLSILLAAVLVLTMLPVSAFAKNAETTYPVTGTCGDNLTWTLDEQGTFTISGTGEMWYDCSLEWISYSDNIKNVVIGDGVTSI